MSARHVLLPLVQAGLGRLDSGCRWLERRLLESARVINGGFCGGFGSGLGGGFRSCLCLAAVVAVAVPILSREDVDLGKVVSGRRLDRDRAVRLVCDGGVLLSVRRGSCPYARERDGIGRAV